MKTETKTTHYSASRDGVMFARSGEYLGHIAIDTKAGREQAANDAAARQLGYKNTIDACAKGPAGILAKIEEISKPTPPAPTQAAHTAGKLYFEQSATSIRLAKLDGREIQPHEGYNRDNDGSWYVGIEKPDGERGAFCTAHMKADAKRGQGFQTPDPEGQANAAHIVKCVNAHAQLVAAMEGLLAAIGEMRNSSDYLPGERQRNYALAIQSAEIALAAAR